MMKLGLELDLGSEMAYGTIFMNKYIPTYWHYVDRTNDGLLNYSEFKMVWSDIAAIMVQV